MLRKAAPEDGGNVTSKEKLRHMHAASPADPNKKSGRLIFLEYLRIYAFLNVLITHLFPQDTKFDISNSTNIFYIYFAKVWNLFVPILLGNGTGVPVFFLVSGYIIFNVAERETTASFVIRRIFRIYPLYIFAILCQFQISDGKIPPWSSLWPRFSLLGDFMGTGQVLNGVDWTLRIEILFYALVAILSLARILKPNTKIKLYVLPIVVLICIVMPSFPSWQPNTFGALNRNFPLFMLGAGIYYFETRRIGINLLILITALVFFGHVARTDVIAFGLFLFAWLARDRLKFNKLVLSVSSVTYAVYLYHAWFFGDMMKMLESAGTPAYLSTILALIILFVVCYLVHFLIERPFIAFGRIISRSVDGLLATAFSGRIFSSRADPL